MHLVLVASFLLGTLSAWLRRNKLLSLTGIASTLAAALLGGAQAGRGAGGSAWLGVDFAVHTPAWDLLFGTYYLPDRWPSAYGLVHHRDVPSGWGGQLIHPLRRLLR